MKLTRTLISLVLTLLMLLSVAVAENPTVTTTLPQDVEVNKPVTIFQIQYNGDNYDWRIDRIVDGVASGATVDDDSSETVGSSNLSGDTSVVWDYWYDGDYTAYDGGVNHQLVVSVNGVATTVVDFFVNYFANHSFDRVSLTSWLESQDGTLTEILNPVVSEAPWMWQNTVCSFGPHFRDIDPELTDKWYMFSAIDLSQDGVQTYELVAGGRYKIGNVTIAVNGDEVTVDYDYFNDLYVYNQGDFFTIFPDFDSITTVEPSELTAMEYGKTYSIANDLGGDTNVLLYTCNVVNFQTDIEGIERFYENIPWRKELRQSMLELAGLAE